MILATSELNSTAIAVVAACVVAWGLVADRLRRWNVSGPMAFVVLGLVTANGPTGFVHVALHSSTIRSVAELSLAVVLFADASRVNVRVVRHEVGVPARLLALGLPLSIAAGAAVALGLFGGNVWVACAVGAIVAPTDAALGAAIVSDERVPGGVRRALNIESGLNDGIATPFVNLFLAGAVAAEAVAGTRPGAAAAQLFGGAGIGLGLGVVGAVLGALARRRHWSDAAFRPMAVLALAVLAYAMALEAGTNGFVAAFVAGAAFGSTLPATDDAGEAGALLSLTEDAGELLSLLVWYLFGAVMLVPAMRLVTWQDAVFAVLALTATRMLPVAVALAGSGLSRATVVFVGWFGPRGLASVVFALIAVDTLETPEAHLVLGAVGLTVLLSVVAHGVSAGPLVRAYASRAARVHPDAPEHTAAPEVPTRTLAGTPRYGRPEA